MRLLPRACAWGKSPGDLQLTKDQCRVAVVKNKTANNNSLINPGKYVHYGSIAYKVLLYGHFKKGRSFTTTNYREFMLNKISAERIREAVNFLSDIGYLTKHDNPGPTHHRMKNMFTITLTGQHALIYLAGAEKEREHKKRSKHGSANSKVRWTSSKPR